MAKWRLPMFKLSQRSFQRLAGVHPKLVETEQENDKHNTEFCI